MYEYFFFSFFFFFSSRRRHTRWPRDWSSDVCSSDLFTRHHDYVCAVIAKLFPQFSLSIHIQIEYGGGDARSYHHGEQRGRGTAAAQYSSADQHPQKHRPVRSGRAALFCQLKVHASPRNAYTGSNFTARRIANVLPANVTPIAMARIIGSSTGSIVI